MGGRVVGVVRVSEVKGREGDSFISPIEQTDRLARWAEAQGFQMVACHEELDISGGASLNTRHGLRTSIETIENGQADILAVAYFDRLVRSLKVQDEVVTRVETAGGRLVTLDIGDVSYKTAGQWLSATMIGAVSEYYRRSVKERAGEAQIRAVARGVLPYPVVPHGYRRNPDGTLDVHHAEAKIVHQAFQMRAQGAPIREVRQHLATHGIRRTWTAVANMLASRVYLGEIHFGKLINLAAHEPIVERDLWNQVQKTRAPKGRKAKTSNAILARLGILRCGTCNARMVVGTGRSGTYRQYRCPPAGDCPQRMTISAQLVEDIVVTEVREAFADVEGRASMESNAREAAETLAAAQADLDAAIRAFAGLEGEQAAVDRIGELRAIRDEAQARVDHLGRPIGGLVFTVNDWDRMTPDEQRAAIRLVVEAVHVAPGRGADRVRIKLLGQ